MFERVAEWNKRCCKEPHQIGSEEYWESLSNQLERIKEELDETIEAVNKRDLAEVLDGGIDMDVTVCGFNYLADLDYKKNSEKVLDNNDLKYSMFPNQIDYTFIHNGWTKNDYEIKTTYDYINEGVQAAFHSIHRKSDDKIMKLANHPKVTLEVPDGL